MVLASDAGNPRRLVQALPSGEVQRKPAPGRQAEFCFAAEVRLEHHACHIPFAGAVDLQAMVPALMPEQAGRRGN